MSVSRESRTGRLGVRKELALEALLASASITAAAEKSGVPVSTLRRWRKDSAFAAAFAELKAELLDGTVDKLRSEGRAMAEVLTSIANNNGMPPAQRVRAASRAIELLLRAAELQDVERRLAALEAEHAEKG